jgi:F0F1-type ATP synthase assembly protein I
LAHGDVLYFALKAQEHRVRNKFRPLILMQLGLIMVSSILLSLAVGLWIDNWFGISPFGLLVAMLVGVSAGSLAVYRLVSSVLDELGGGKRK